MTDKPWKREGWDIDEAPIEEVLAALEDALGKDVAQAVQRLSLSTARLMTQSLEKK